MFAFFPLLSLLVLVAAVLSAPLAARDGSGAVTGAVGLGFYSPSLTLGTKGYPDPNTYTCYSGPASNFPAPSKWMSFDNMWTLLHSAALTPIGDSPAEVQAIKNAILSISSSAKVDARVILAVIVLESTGNVRVGCTNNGVENCGLMQSHDPTVKVYNPHNMQASITQMVRDGTQGTATGPGLVQYFDDAKDTGVKTGGNLWKVLRAYNSGKIDAANLSDGQGATTDYVSNIANYLQGWHGWGQSSTKCHF